MATSGISQAHLAELGESIREHFADTCRVLAFGEYLDLLSSEPTVQLRSSAQYLRDCFDYYGSEWVKRPYGRFQRFTLFDCPWADGRERLVGQEEVQNRVYRCLETFVNEGTANKLILLHGPNGSSKSTLVRCIGRAMEDYSRRDEGALYRFNWVFPGRKVAKTEIGFSGDAYPESHAGSFAHLSDEYIDARLTDELSDHPVLLIPVDKRGELLDQWVGEDSTFTLSDYMRFGELSPKNKAIYEALLSSYQGDYLRVLRHVQVERFYVEHRYRRGYVAVEPQLSVDANERQITADRSVSALPAALQSLSLYEYGGELVNANRGLVEYSDLLKRPLEAFKYLLGTMETSSVGLSFSTLFFDQVCVGTSNEIHLSAFKEIPEFQSFKGRLELVRVPYLLDATLEEAIYEDKLREAARSRHIAPHCAFVAALWSVLTRMRKPMSDKYAKGVSDLVGKLSPLEKAELYAKGRVPDSLNSAQGKELLSVLTPLWQESRTYPNYEGRTGASPREMQSVLFNAANTSDVDFVSPTMILAEIEELAKQTSVYQFLRQEALPGGYHDHRKFIALVRKRYLDRVDDEVRVSLGLVAEEEYKKLFESYLDHVMHWVRKERIQNPNTGKYEDADESLMKNVEKTLEVSSKKEDFRRDLISKIGAWSLDHPSEKPRYTEIFSDYFKRLRDDYHEKQRKTVQEGIRDLLSFLNEGGGRLEKDAAAQSESALNTLIERFHYRKDSALDAVALLAKVRYG